MYTNLLCTTDKTHFISTNDICYHHIELLNFKFIDIMVILTRFFSALKDCTIIGCILIIPLVLSIYLAYSLVVFIEQRLEYLFTFYYPSILNQYLDISIPGAKLLVVFILMTIIGYFVINFLGKKLLELLHNLINYIPIIRVLYNVIEKVFIITLDQDQKYFSKVVLIPYPNPNIWSIGFITLESQRQFSTLLNNDVVTVFLPTAPSPFSGLIVYVPKKDVIAIDISIEEAFSLIISLGTLELQNKSLLNSNFKN